MKEEINYELIEQYEKQCKKDSNFPVKVFIKNMALTDTKIIMQLPTYFFLYVDQKVYNYINFNILQKLAKFLLNCGMEAVYTGTYTELTSKLDVRFKKLANQLLLLEKYKIIKVGKHNNTIMIGFHKELAKKIEEII